MSALDGTHRASYKDVPFLVTNASTAGGRKLVTKRFPGSSRQLIEDLGGIPRSYNFEILITEAQKDDTGNAPRTYEQEKARILAALEEGGVGTLFHPFLGRIERVVAGNYTLNESFTDVGVGRLSVPFNISDSDGLPAKSTTVLSNVNAALESVLAAITTDITDEFNVTTSFTGNFTAAVEKVQGMVDEFNSVIGTVAPLSDGIDAVSREINALESGVNSLVLEPADLAGSVLGIFSSMDDLFESPGDTLDVFKQIFTFGSNDVDIPQTTAGRVERKTNNELMNDTMNVTSLGYGYLNAAQIDFETVEEIEEAADSLEDQYQLVVKSEGVSDATLSEMSDLRTTTQSFFDEARLTAKQVLEIETRPTSARLLSYSNYGDSTRSESLTKLNDLTNPAFIDAGTVKVLTQ